MEQKLLEKLFRLFSGFVGASFVKKSQVFGIGIIFQMKRLN